MNITPQNINDEIAFAKEMIELYKNNTPVKNFWEGRLQSLVAIKHLFELQE